MGVAFPRISKAPVEKNMPTRVMPQMVHSVGMAGRYMSVDNGGNAASNMIRMKLFNVFFAKAKRPAENSPAVVAYSTRASFSQERMTCIQDEAKVVYQSKDGRKEKRHDAYLYIGVVSLAVVPRSA